jgi:hypothetical protein
MDSFVGPASIKDRDMDRILQIMCMHNGFGVEERV